MTMIMTYVLAFLTVTAYEPVDSGVIFNHKNHVADRAIQCVKCHNVAASESSQDKNIPGHDVCSECHSVENAPEDCRLCHTNPDSPTGVTIPQREIIFPHKGHLKDKPRNEACLACHQNVNSAEKPLTISHFPEMGKCIECHENNSVSTECKQCHSRPEELAQAIHPPDWMHSHKFDANAAGNACKQCHEVESYCTDCHVGESVSSVVHEFNYAYTHGLDARAKENECQSCHNYETFCQECHEQQGAIPLNHLSPQWSPRTNPAPHAEAARLDIENCASCHNETQSTCSQPGCHRDGDGIIGTDPSVHDTSVKDIGKGPWHDDDDFQCFQCHENTRQSGRGFCGYCHESEDDD